MNKKFILVNMYEFFYQLQEVKLTIEDFLSRKKMIIESHFPFWERLSIYLIYEEREILIVSKSIGKRIHFPFIII